MPLLTTAQEYQAVRLAIQSLTTTGQSVTTFSVDGITVTYAASQLTWLQSRETELAKRITTRNRRKRVSPDFSFTP